MLGHSVDRSLFTDLLAGFAMGGAVGWAASSALHVPPVIAACAAGITFVRVFPSLRRLHSGEFRMAAFRPETMQFEAIATSSDHDLWAVEDLAASISAEPLPEADEVVFPTVRALQASIERRLSAQGMLVQPDAAGEVASDDSTGDASEELRAALGDLRRALG